MTTESIYIARIDDRPPLEDIISKWGGAGPFQAFSLAGLRELVAKKRHLKERAPRKGSPRGVHKRQLLIKSHRIPVTDAAACTWAQENGWEMGLLTEFLVMFEQSAHTIKGYPLIYLPGTIHEDPELAIEREGPSLPMTLCPLVETFGGESSIRLVESLAWQPEARVSRAAFFYSRDA